MLLRELAGTGVARQDTAEISLISTRIIALRIRAAIPRAHGISGPAMLRAADVKILLSSKNGRQSIWTGIYALRFLVSGNFVIFIAVTPAANRL